MHPRTRSQGYRGEADWSIIKAVKDNVNIPVIGNGDIKTPEDAKRMLDETGCDAIMIGRGVLGNPWLIEQTVAYLNGDLVFQPNRLDRVDMCIKHLNYLSIVKDEKVARLEIRNHIGWYFKGLPGANEIKNKVYQCDSIHDIMQVLMSYREELLNG